MPISTEASGQSLLLLTGVEGGGGGGGCMRNNNKRFRNTGGVLNCACVTVDLQVKCYQHLHLKIL